MNLPYQLFVGLRYLRARKRSRSISVNTAISVGGVALGVAALVIVLSVMSGFHNDLQRKILGVNSHIVVTHYQGALTDYERVETLIRSLPGVTATSPMVLSQVMLSGGGKPQGVVLRGIDPDREQGTTDLLGRIIDGSVDNLEGGGETPPGIVIGRELARNLGVFVGDTVRMVSPRDLLGPMGVLPKVARFRVAAIFEVGMFEYDGNLACIHIRTAQDFLDLGEAVTGVEVKLKDPFKARETAEEIQAGLGFPYSARDWMRMNKNLFSALKLEKYAMFVILVLIVLVAAFNIVSTLVMIVIDKSRDIAILKAMGASDGGILTIFMVQGLIIGVVGTVIGLSVGYAACWLLDRYKFIRLPADVYYLNHLPVTVDAGDFAAVAAAAVGISLLATIYPSLQAARIDPVEPLRYE